MLRTRQQHEQQQFSASSTGVQQQMRAPPRHLQRSSRRRNCLTTSRACKLVWHYSNLRLAERTQSLEQGPQAPAWEVFSDDEECQGSDADNSSSEGVDKKTDCLKLFYFSQFAFA